MDTKVNRTGRLSLVSILAVLFFGLCFLSYSSKPQDAENGEKLILEENNIEETPRTSFEEIYEQLDMETREKLQKPVTLIFSHTKVDQIIMHLSKQVGVNITASGFSERMDCVYQNIPAVTALKNLSKDKPWHWEKRDSSLFIYENPIPESVYVEFDEFCKMLDNETREKLKKPVTIIFSNTEIDMILQVISKQIGITITSKGIENRLDMINQNVPAISILENLVKSYLWKMEMIDNVVVISPVFPQSSGALKDENPAEAPEVRLRFHLFKILAEPPEPVKVEISESCKNGDFEDNLNRWVDEKSLMIIGSPVIVKKGNEPANLEISEGEVDINIQINKVRLQGPKIHANVTLGFRNKTKTSGLNHNLDFMIVKEGQLLLIHSTKEDKFQLDRYGAVCKVESISRQNPGKASNNEERIRAHQEKVRRMLEERNKKAEETP